MQSTTDQLHTQFPTPVLAGQRGTRCGCVCCTHVLDAGLGTGPGELAWGESCPQMSLMCQSEAAAGINGRKHKKRGSSFSKAYELILSNDFILVLLSGSLQTRNKLNETEVEHTNFLRARNITCATRRDVSWAWICRHLLLPSHVPPS